MSELDSFPGHLIRRLHQRSVAIYSSYADELDVTQVQFAALCSLDATPGIDQVNLATSIALDKVTTGEVVARLVKKGLVRREDARRVRPVPSALLNLYSHVQTWLYNVTSR